MKKYRDQVNFRKEAVEEASPCWLSQNNILIYLCLYEIFVSCQGGRGGNGLVWVLYDDSLLISKAGTDS
jgi:hypothetical protein